ncbi:hypothetical protein IJG14_05625 [bacterium]|nr:hypothetical protein [bacterium]
MTQGYSDNLYLIDLSYLNTPSEIIYDLSSILDTEPAKNQKVKLKLGNVDFNKSQLLSIKSLIESINSTLAIVEGKSDITRASAISAGLVYQSSVDMVQDSTFFSKDNADKISPAAYTEVTPELFPSVDTLKDTHYEKPDVSNNDIDEKSESVSDNLKQNNETASSFENIQSVGESFEIKPQQFETTDENLKFNENNSEWLNTEQPSKVQELGDVCNKNLIKSEKNNNDDSNRVENIMNKVNSLFEGESSEYLTSNQEVVSSTVEKENTNIEIDISNPGIQSLDDIPLNIPSDKEIQEELDVIYDADSAEKKLDDLFASTGLKEEKFQSIKDIPKAEEKEYTQYDFELEAFPTKYLKQTICTGQYISFEGNLVIIGDCHEGSEISASGDVTIWGELSGSVHAGKNGNEKSKIRALKMNASQLRIANCYVKRPDVLSDASKVDSIPEEAMIVNGEIAVYKIYK